MFWVSNKITKDFGLDLFNDSQSSIKHKMHLLSQEMYDIILFLSRLHFYCFIYVCFVLLSFLLSSASFSC